MLLDGPSASTFGALASWIFHATRTWTAGRLWYVSFEQGLHVFDAVRQSSTLNRSNGTLSRGNGDGDYEAGAKHAHYAFVLF